MAQLALLFISIFSKVGRTHFTRHCILWVFVSADRAVFDTTAATRIAITIEHVDVGVVPFLVEPLVSYIVVNIGSNPWIIIAVERGIVPPIITLAQWLVRRSLDVHIGKVNGQSLFNRTPRLHGVPLFKLQEKFVVLSFDPNRYFAHWHSEVYRFSELLVPPKNYFHVSVLKVPNDKA